MSRLYAPVETLHDRDVHALLEHRASLRPHTQSTDIDDVSGVREQSNDLLVMEGRTYNGQIMQMAGAEPRIVRDIMVARAHCVNGKFLQEMADALRHRVDMAWRAGYRLRHHAALKIIDAR